MKYLVYIRAKMSTATYVRLVYFIQELGFQISASFERGNNVSDDNNSDSDEDINKAGK